MQELFSVLAQHYNCVSYHNFSHAFNLMLVHLSSCSSIRNVSTASHPSPISFPMKNYSVWQLLHWRMTWATVGLITTSRCRGGLKWLG